MHFDTTRLAPGLAPGSWGREQLDLVDAAAANPNPLQPLVLHEAGSAPNCSSGTATGAVEACMWHVLLTHIHTYTSKHASTCACLHTYTHTRPGCSPAHVAEVSEVLMRPMAEIEAEIRGSLSSLPEVSA